MRLPENRWLTLALFIASSLVAGAIGSVATASSVESWYPTLRKPSWNPPSTVFGPVWTTLYILMGVAAWRVWLKQSTPRVSGAIAGFFAHLGLNAFWSVLFFGLRSPGAALIEIVVLWASILWLGVLFFRIDRLAGVLWLPYLAWVSFAMVLNGHIYLLNR